MIDILLYTVAAVLSIGIVAAFFRLSRGPDLPNRVIAFDLMVTLGIGIIAIVAAVTRQSVYLDVATILALISFLGTVAFAYYLERRGSEDVDA